jgi:hypothetical protein
MNRRKFLTFLALAPLAVKAAPLLKLLPKLPEPEKGGWVSYRFKYTVTMPPSSTMRLRMI